MKPGYYLGGVLVLLMVLALAPGVALAHGDTSVAVQPLTPRPDQVITVKGEALGPKSEVEVRIVGNGADVDLGEVKADEEGDFSKEFRLPADLKPGTYQVKAIGEESATTQITVQEGPAGSAAREEQPSDEAVPNEEAGADEGATEEGAAEEGAMGPEPVIEQRPLGQSIGLVALFGALAALGLFFAHRPIHKA